MEKEDLFDLYYFRLTLAFAGQYLYTNITKCWWQLHMVDDLELILLDEAVFKVKIPYGILSFFIWSFIILWTLPTLGWLIAENIRRVVNYSHVAGDQVSTPAH